MMKNRKMEMSKLNSIFSVIFCIFMLINSSNLFVSGKNIDQLSRSRQKDENSCERVKQYFDTIGITISPTYDKTGQICGGHCCDNSTEDEILVQSTQSFEGLIRQNTKSLKGLWEQTANVYKDYVLELSRQSENKTLNLFSQVYRRMSPLSRDPILELYKSIRGHITSSEPSSDDALEQVIEKFFINLFPVAYHHVVHTTQNIDDVSLKDFHADYKNCLTHTFNQLQPFGEIPSRISRSLVQSVGAANVLLRALQQGSAVLGSTDSLPLDILSTKCKHALVKMNYCASCKGHNFHHSKPCFGFCTNVMRGCLTQYIGGLDKDWSSFSEGVDRLTTLVRSKDGIEAIIKGLDGKLSEAIMFAMENGPDLEKKVKKACGAPSLATNDKLALDVNPTPVVKVEDAGSLQNKQYTPIQQTNKWPQPPDNQMLLFINTLEKSKEFSLRIATSYCDDDRFQKDDKDCWTGDYLADYTHQIISMHSQKYNPEVPTPEITSSQPGSKIHLLNDKLINLRNMVLKPVTAHSSKLDSGDKMLSDMAEGSGNYYRNFDDDDDYGSGSGDGHGRTHGGTIARDGITPYNVPKIIPGDGLTPVAGSGTSLRISIFKLVSSIIVSSCLVLSSNVILFRPH